MIDDARNRSDDHRTHHGRAAADRQYADHHQAERCPKQYRVAQLLHVARRLGQDVHGGRAGKISERARHVDRIVGLGFSDFLALSFGLRTAQRAGLRRLQRDIHLDPVAERRDIRVVHRPHEHEIAGGRTAAIAADDRGDGGQMQLTADRDDRRFCDELLTAEFRAKTLRQLRAWDDSGQCLRRFDLSIHLVEDAKVAADENAGRQAHIRHVLGLQVVPREVRAFTFAVQVEIVPVGPVLGLVRDTLQVRCDRVARALVIFVRVTAIQVVERRLDERADQHDVRDRRK